MENGSKAMTVTIRRRLIFMILMVQLLLANAPPTTAASDRVDFKENETLRANADNEDFSKSGGADDVTLDQGQGQDLDHNDQDQDQDDEDMIGYLNRYFNHADWMSGNFDEDKDSSDDPLYLFEDDEGDDDDDGDGDSDEDVVQKRNLGVLARKGDIAARRIHIARNYEDLLGADDDDDDDDDYYYLSNKRHIGSAHVRGHRPKQQQQQQLQKRIKENNDDDDDDDNDADDDEESYVGISKRNIAALARQGTLTNLRYQRRPVPSIAESDYYSGMGSHDGFKRNLHAFSRVTTPGYGFRSWIRGRLSASADKQQQQQQQPQRQQQQKQKLSKDAQAGSKPRNRRVPFIRQVVDSAPTGRVSAAAMADRFRNVRSNRLRYLQGGSPTMSSSWSSRPTTTTTKSIAMGRGLHGGRVASSMRAPMAFVSRHPVWKRAATSTSAPSNVQGSRSRSRFQVTGNRLVPTQKSN